MATQAIVRTPNEQEIRDELERVLSSSTFRGTKRCKDFTQYVCLKALQGESGTLKERTIAIDVFNRRSAEDSADENIVRVGAREVRKRLAIYYSSEGADDPVRIELPIGSYVPVFHYRAETSHGHDIPLSLVTDQANSRLPRRTLRDWRWMTVAVACLTLLGTLATAAWLRSERRPGTQFSSFWEPAFASSAPLVVLSHPIVYEPSSRALRLDEQMNGLSELPVQRAIKLPSNMVNGSDFVPVFNEYVGLGDATAALDMYSLFAQHSIKPQLRMADKLDFEDLYGSTAVLIGGSFSNRWTAEVTKNLRYRFRFEEQSKPWIIDSDSKQMWGLAGMTDDQRTPEDYILICRMPHAQTGKFMLIVAGLTVFGTEAGGKVLSDPSLLEPILKNLPKDWAARNLEMVMRVEVIGGGPALPKLVAAYTW